MKLAFTMPPLRRQMVTREEIIAILKGSYKEGFFDSCDAYSEKDGILRITFRPTIYLDKALSKEKLAGVERHEAHHYQDFQRRASDLKAGIMRAIKTRHDPNIDDRWAWFQYDLAQDSNTFHRRVGGIIRVVSEPNLPRPR